MKQTKKKMQIKKKLSKNDIKKKDKLKNGVTKKPKLSPSKEFESASDSEISESELLGDDFEDEIEENEVDEVASEAELEEEDENQSEDGSDKLEQSDEGNLDSEDEAEQHKKSLAKLAETDPEFYKFLQENDKKLLNFDVSDDEGKEDEEEVDELHKPDEGLEVASDESDFEGDGDEEKDERVITLKLLKKWQADIQTDKSSKTINCLVQAFQAALRRVGSGEEEQEPTLYKVDGSSVFNAVIQLCVLELGPAIRRFLGLKQGSRIPPHKCKRFVKLKKLLKNYFTDLLKLLTVVTSANIQTVLLKHLHYMSPMLVSFPNVTKSIAKRLIHLWGTAEENVRVVAFFCILRITNNQQASILDTVLKSMYLTYVKNSKFVSLQNLATINFMRRSLAEMFALDVNVAYQHVFLYIRQLAIHLRNAITVKKKENTQAVYNWQFVNSLRLWGNLLAVTSHKPQLQQLVYPFVQVCLGTIKLVPTAQYYPLRFHIVKILIDLSKDLGVFVPVLPFILEVLTSYDFNKKHQKVSMKPMHFTCLLRLSKSQLSENGFKDMVIETIYGSLLEYLSNQSSSFAFPDLTLICVIQIKEFLKKCRNVNYNRKLKQVLEKIEQNNQFIEKERRKTSFNITDFKKIDGWEAQIRSKGTPMMEYFESWSKVHNLKKNKQLTNNEQLGDYKLPTIKKVNRAEKKSEGPVVLFPSDSEDEEEEVNVNRKRGKRGGKGANKRVNMDTSEPVEDNGVEDVVEDIQVDDW